jgi:hypothetical protein
MRSPDLSGFPGALHDRDARAAHDLLAEELRPEETSGEYAGPSDGIEVAGILEAYEQLEICEFQFGEGSMLTVRGLLYNNGRLAQFAGSLAERSDRSWRVYHLEIFSQVDSTLMKRCTLGTQ